MYNKFIGQTFKSRGLVDTKTMKIEDIYFLAGRKRYPAFKA